MKDRRHRNRTVSSDDLTGFTQSLHDLLLRDTSVNVHDDDETSPKTVLLVCRDSVAKKWGPRWLNEAGLRATFAPDTVDALSTARSIHPHVIVLDAGLRDRDGFLLFDQLNDAADIEAPIIALCSGNKEVTDAMDAGVYEIARKPFDWRLIANRARIAAGAQDNAHKLAVARDSLQQALAIADSARERLRSRESFEPVTGLPNKAKFIELVGRGMIAADRDNTALAVIAISFNRFRLVAEALGQENVDKVLSNIGGC